MSDCVCGHGRDEHADAKMSVPLEWRKPLYELPGSVFNNHINRVHPTATYDQQLCHCGCSSFEADGEAVGLIQTL